MRRTVLLAIALLAPSVDAGAPKDAPSTLMLQPGKLLVSENLDQPLGKGWFASKGAWQVVDGAMQAKELSSDMHAGVRRREVKFTSAIVQFSFKFDGATMASLSMNADKGHVCRVRFTPTSFSVIRDKDKAKNDKSAELDTCKAEFKKGQWHTMVVEMHGKDMLARVDDKYIAFGSHEGLTTPKASVGFTVKGDSISFKNLRVYEGTPLKTWDESRAKLVAERKK